MTGFLGPNGAGKSTSMRMMVGLTTPTSGTATISGRRFADLPNPGREVGVMLDASAQHAGRTGREILTIAQQIMGVPAPRVAEMLELVSLTATEADRRVGNYSLGMRQRLGIAAALIGDPAVLILDEPANGLDPAGIRWMRDLLRDYADHGGTVLLSSHLLPEIEIIADDIVMIGQGRIVCQGSKAELLQAAGHRRPRRGHRRPPARAGRGRSRRDRLRGRVAPHRRGSRPGRASGVRRRRGAHRAPHRRQWRARGDVPRAHRRHPTRPTQRGQRHDHHRPSTSVRDRSTYRDRADPAQPGRPRRAPQDVRHPLRLLADREHRRSPACIATIATIAFAPDEDLTYYTFAKAVGFPITVILPMVALLSITSEWSQRSGLTTFTYVPSRRRVIGAKTLSSVVVAVASMLFAFVVGAVGNVVGSAIAGTPTVWDLSVGHAADHRAGQPGLACSIGTMLGMLLRSSAGGLVAYFVLVLLVPNLSGLLAASQDWFTRPAALGRPPLRPEPTCSRGCTPAPSGRTSPPPSSSGSCCPGSSGSAW